MPDALTDDRHVTTDGTVSRGLRVDTPAFILLSGLGLTCALLMSCAVGLWTLHRNELRETQHNLNRLSRILSEQTALAFHEIDTVAKEARLVRQRTPDASDLLRHEQLHRIFHGFLQGQALLLFDAKGQMRAHSRVFPTPDVNVADRDYFKAHLNDSRDVPYISKPLRNRVNGHWMISLSRRLSAPDGAFGGVVMAAIEMEYFNRLYRSLNLPAASRIVLARNDGTVLATFPFDAARLGSRFSAKTADPDDLVATSPVGDLPMAISLLEPRNVALRHWHSLAMLLSPGAILAVLGLGLLTRSLLTRVKRDRDQAHRQHRQLERQVRERTENLHDLLAFNRKIIDASPVGIAAYTREGDCLIANDVFSGILDLTRDTLEAKRFDELTMLRRSGLAQAAAHTLDTGLTVHAEGACDASDGGSRWIDFQTVRFTKGNRDHLLLLLSDITRRKKMEEELRTLAFTDPLTGVHNRRRFLELAQCELKRAQRHDRPFSFVILDIDFFKDINDTYGHDLGDLVLTRLAGTCQQVLRETDIFGRLGGEEFGIILVETDLEQAVATAERLRLAVEQDALEVQNGRARLTISLGVAQWRASDATFGNLMRRADKALYTAKNQGRNRVVAG